MPRPLPARINLRVKQETYDIYSALASELNVETAGLVRQMIEEGEASILLMTQAIQELKAGRSAAGLGLFKGLLDGVVLSGQVSQQQIDVMGAAVERSRVEDASAVEVAS